jgi:hypothetical protein
MMRFLADADFNHAIVKVAGVRNLQWTSWQPMKQSSREFPIRMFSRSPRSKIESWLHMIVRPCRGISPSF